MNTVAKEVLNYILQRSITYLGDHFQPGELNTLTDEDIKEICEVIGEGIKSQRE